LTSRPDIIFLVLDTQRADRLSCYGYERDTSPQIDALAADATFFRYGVSPAQWTMPSHASMFTGVYPPVHATQQVDSVLPDSLPTLAERLRDGGYFTAAFCNNPLVGVINNGLRRGFYSFLNYSGLLTSRPNQAGMRLNIIGRYRQFFKRFLASIVHRIQDAFAHSDRLLSIALSPLMAPLWQTALNFKGNTSKSLNDAAHLLIERQNVVEGQPVFCFINLMGAHMPFHPPRRFIERFAPTVLRDKEAQLYLRRFNSDPFGWLTPLASPMADKHKAILDGMYDAEVATQDEQVGAFVNRLRASGVLDHTFLMVVADHGEHLGEKSFMGHSVSLYKELTHVPLIIRDPSGSLPRGGTVNNVVSTRRIYHTALTVAGLADEAEEAYTLQNTTSDPDEGWVFAEAVPPKNVISLMRRHNPQLIDAHHYDQTRRAVWNGSYKYIITGNKLRELYNIIDDPQETTNLCDTQPEKATTLYERLIWFEHHTTQAAMSAGRIMEEDDPQVLHRLRALGYLE